MALEKRQRSARFSADAAKAAAAELAKLREDADALFAQLRENHEGLAGSLRAIASLPVSCQCTPRIPREAEFDALPQAVSGCKSVNKGADSDENEAAQEQIQVSTNDLPSLAEPRGGNHVFGVINRCPGEQCAGIPLAADDQNIAPSDKATASSTSSSLNSSVPCGAIHVPSTAQTADSDGATAGVRTLLGLRAKGAQRPTAAKKAFGVESSSAFSAGTLKRRGRPTPALSAALSAFKNCVQGSATESLVDNVADSEDSPELPRLLVKAPQKLDFAEFSARSKSREIPTPAASLHDALKSTVKTDASKPPWLVSSLPSALPVGKSKVGASMGGCIAADKKPWSLILDTDSSDEEIEFEFSASLTHVPPVGKPQAETLNSRHSAPEKKSKSINLDSDSSEDDGSFEHSMPHGRSSPDGLVKNEAAFSREFDDWRETPALVSLSEDELFLDLQALTSLGCLHGEDGSAGEAISFSSLSSSARSTEITKACKVSTTASLYRARDSEHEDAASGISDVKSAAQECSDSSSDSSSGDEHWKDKLQDLESELRYRSSIAGFSRRLQSIVEAPNEDDAENEQAKRN